MKGSDNGEVMPLSFAYALLTVLHQRDQDSSLLIIDSAEKPLLYFLDIDFVTLLC